jgi:hypothetical protein
MIDATTDRRLTVSSGGKAGPYIMLPLSQLDTVTRLLDAHKVRYWVDEEALSIDGGPEIIVINLARHTDPAAIQQLLDSTP